MGGGREADVIYNSHLTVKMCWWWRGGQTGQVRWEGDHHPGGSFVWPTSQCWTEPGQREKLGEASGE